VSNAQYLARRLLLDALGFTEKRLSQLREDDQPDKK